MEQGSNAKVVRLMEEEKDFRAVARTTEKIHEAFVIRETVVISAIREMVVIQGTLVIPGINGVMTEESR